MKFNITDALSSKDKSFTISNNDYNSLVWNDSSPKPTLKELEDLRDQMQKEFDSKKYQRDRAVAYDPIPEQLDQIFHNIDDWKKKIQAVKSKYPKP